MIGAVSTRRAIELQPTNQNGMHELERDKWSDEEMQPNNQWHGHVDTRHSCHNESSHESDDHVQRELGEAAEREVHVHGDEIECVRYVHTARRATPEVTSSQARKSGWTQCWRTAAGGLEREREPLPRCNDHR